MFSVAQPKMCEWQLVIHRPILCYKSPKLTSLIKLTSLLQQNSEIGKLQVCGVFVFVCKNNHFLMKWTTISPWFLLVCFISYIKRTALLFVGLKDDTMWNRSSSNYRHLWIKLKLTAFCVIILGTKAAEAYASGQNVFVPAPQVLYTACGRLYERWIKLSTG